MIKNGDVLRLKKASGKDDLVQAGDTLEVVYLTGDSIVCTALGGIGEGSMTVVKLDDVEVVTKEEIALSAITDNPLNELWNKLRVVARDEDLGEVKNIVRAIELYDRL